MELVTKANELLAKAKEIEDADAVRVPPAHVVDRDQPDNRRKRAFIEVKRQCDCALERTRTTGTGDAALPRAIGAGGAPSGRIHVASIRIPSVKGNPTLRRSHDIVRVALRLRSTSD
jgi:hypothetical protein